MEDFTVSEKNLVLSVIENFVSSKVRSNPDVVTEMIEEASREFLEVLQSTAARLPDSNFAVVMPLQRPALSWYQESVHDLRSILEDGINSMKLDNVTKIDCISTITQQFETDEVHLTSSAGKCFLDFILGQAESFFNSTRIDLTDDVSDFTTPSRFTTACTSGPSLESRLFKLESDSRTRQLSDNMMFARLREEIDTTTNRSKEDRVLINGLVCKKPIPSEIKARTSMLTEVAMEIFNFLIPSFHGRITFITQGRTGESMLPMVEVRLNSVEVASSIRKGFATKSKAKQLTGDREKLFITNSVTLSTRVRIDVMKAIAKSVSTKDVLAYVIGFISRPVLHVRRRADSNGQRSYTFVDAVGLYGHLLRPSDLASAYRRAGRAFDGQLQQNFIVLNKADREICWGTGSRPAAGTSSYRGSGRGQGGGAGYRGGDRGRRDGAGAKRHRSPDHDESGSAVKSAKVK
jgi:hypothetical protein